MCRDTPCVYAYRHLLIHGLMSNPHVAVRGTGNKAGRGLRVEKTTEHKSHISGGDEADVPRTSVVPA